MKSNTLKRILLIISFIGSLTAYTQSPLQFNYQAVARDNRGIPLVLKEITIRFTITSDSEKGPMEYSETRKVKTNQFGMFTVAVGSEGYLSRTGGLNDVKWESGKKFLHGEIDHKGNNNFVHLGATQLVSVPYALFALKTAESNSEGSSTFSGAAGNGLSIEDSLVMFGNNEGDESAKLSSNRVLPLNGKKINMTDGVSYIEFKKDNIEIQQDSALLPGETRNSGSVFLKINPIFPRPDAVPFLFSRLATKQNDGTTSPNEVVMWGHNLAGGGSAYIPNLPAIGYSIESNYRPSPESRWVESHEYYITPQGQQIRLKSYTIKTNSNYVDFYHSVDNFYLKHPRKAEEYFGIATNEENNSQQLYLGNLSMLADKPNNTVQIRSMVPDAALHLDQNWKYLILPGMIVQKDGAIRFSNTLIPELDRISTIGNSAIRFLEVNAYKYNGTSLSIKQGWQTSEILNPTAAIDIEGLQGFNQLRMRKTYTPVNSNDPNGNAGDMAWDQNFIYIKTVNGWKRTALSSF